MPPAGYHLKIRGHGDEKHMDALVLLLEYRVQGISYSRQKGHR